MLQRAVTFDNCVYITLCLSLSCFNMTKAAFHILFFFFFTLVHTADDLTKYTLSSCHLPLIGSVDVTYHPAVQRIVGQKSQKSMLTCTLQNMTRCSYTSSCFGHVTNCLLGQATCWHTKWHGTMGTVQCGRTWPVDKIWNNTTTFQYVKN